MNKPDSLRAWLSAALPDLAREPERLKIFIDKGKLRSTGARGMSFEYQYKLSLVLLDYAGHPDTVMVPLLAWVAIHQSELLHSRDQNRQGITFEADILDDDLVDLSIDLELTERVIVTARAGGGYDVDHAPEPSPDEVYLDGPIPVEPDPVGLGQLYVGGELLFDRDAD